MHHWIDDYTPLRARPKTLDGAQYNQIRIGLLRLGTPLYLPLDEFPGLTCALDPDLWIVFDEINNDSPVLAWSGFQRQSDTALHLPVTCELRLYHVHAGLLMGRALDAIEHAIKLRCSAQRPAGTESVPTIGKA